MLALLNDSADMCRYLYIYNKKGVSLLLTSRVLKIKYIFSCTIIIILHFKYSYLKNVKR